MAEHDHVIGYFDGLCEPNPGGYACCGWNIVSVGEQSASVGGYYIGFDTIHESYDPAAKILLDGCFKTTNNIAEYLAAIECLRKIWRLPWRGPVTLYGDSQLVVNQYSSYWACNSPHLQRLLRHLHVASSHFMSVDLIWIPRKDNAIADAQARRVYREVTGREAPDRQSHKKPKNDNKQKAGKAATWRNDSEEALYWFLTAADEHMGDAPDGAWQAHMEESVEAFNRKNKSHYDPYDMIMRFLERRDEHRSKKL